VASAFADTNPWRDNLTRAEVITALGEPKETLSMGPKEFLDYSGDLRIVLENGVVTEIDGVVPNSLKPVAAPAAPPAAPAPAANTTPAPAPGAPVATPLPASAYVSTAPTPAPAAPAASSPNLAAGALTAGKTNAASATEDNLVSEAANPTPPPELSKLAEAAGVPANTNIPGMGRLTLTESAAPRQNRWIAFGIGLVTTTLCLCLVLKLAFVKKEFPVIWRDIILVSLPTALFYQGLNSLLGGNTFFVIAHMLQADWVPTGGLLLFLILKCTEVKQFATASGIVMAAVGVAMILQFVISIFAA
jgi:hypothetical protein